MSLHLMSGNLQRNAMDVDYRVKAVYELKCMGYGQVENADFSDIADFISPTFINPCFRYSPIANIENWDLKKSEIFKHPCFRYSLYR